MESQHRRLDQSPVKEAVRDLYAHCLEVYALYPMAAVVTLQVVTQMLQRRLVKDAKSKP